MKRITIVLLCLLTIPLSFAQTYKEKPWELVGKAVASIEVQAFLKEMGPTTELDTIENLRTRGKQYKRWANKGISIVIDPYQKNVIEVYLHNTTKNFSPYPYSLFNDLSFRDKGKKILEKLAGYKETSGTFSVYSYDGKAICLEESSYFFLGIRTTKSNMKGEIQYIRHFIDTEKMYKAKYEKEMKENSYYLKTSSDSAWGEMIHTIFDDQLFSWENLEGSKIPRIGQSWDPEYYLCKLQNPTNRKSKMLNNKIIIPMWDRKILLVENTDSVQDVVLAEITYQVTNISDKIDRYFSERNARFEITGDWYNVKKAKISTAYVKIHDLKLGNTQTIRLYMYTVKDDEAINIYYDMYIYRYGSTYDDVIEND